MHLSKVELTLVFSAVRPFENSIALLHVVYVFARVSSAIVPTELSLSVHFSFFPVSLVLSLSLALALLPNALAKTINYVVNQLTTVDVAICPLKFTISSLFALHVLSLK